MAVHSLIREYTRQSDQLRRVIEESNERDIRSHDRRVSQLFDEILDEHPTDGAENKELTEFLLEQLTSFHQDSSLSRRIRDKLHSMAAPDVKKVVTSGQAVSASYGLI